MRQFAAFSKLAAREIVTRLLLIKPCLGNLFSRVIYMFKFKSAIVSIAVLVLTVVAAAPAVAVDDGAATVQGVCFACHQAGMNGAPKFGNKIAWAPRIAQGKDKLYEHALKGLRGMPPRGGTTLPDDQIKLAVDYMVKAAGGYPEK